MSIKKHQKQNKKLWILAFLLIIFIKLFSSHKNWVEDFYSLQFYPFFSRILRSLFGWIPFSLGDLLYFLAACWLIWKMVKNVRLLIKKDLSLRIVLKKCAKLILLFAFIYIVFNIFWGINYNRKGIAYQLHLTHLGYDTSDLIMLQNLLLQKVNATKVSAMRDNANYPVKEDLFKRARICYDEVGKKYSFLQYKNHSIKSSFYGWLGDYLGFTGYYNPFTGEAQVNTTVPPFLQPYITTHEMAHQLGYAKENEANFVGYLAAVNSPDTLFHYSAYFDLFLYANREVYYFDSVAAKESLKQLNPAVKNDILELRQFDLNHKSFIEPAITWLYGNFLKMNQQSQGMHSYNAVVGMLIAYYKKFGKI
ncbi:MAG TPA: DUF3810 domain-containing protein [Hanamia sp.]|nr:DUF3810 domain-containing protein [Hanamia sp.]